MRCAHLIAALLGVVTASLALCPVAEPRGSDPAHTATLQDLESHPVQVTPGGRVNASDSTAMASYQRFLALQHTDPKLRAEALRRLGDLNLDAGDLQRMESELSSVDVHGAAAIKLYTTLLSVYPDYAHNDEVLYQLARAYDTTGQPDQALRTLELIVRRYPDSRNIDEVQFRRAELLFSARRYPQAQQAYAAVIAPGAEPADLRQAPRHRAVGTVRTGAAPGRPAARGSRDGRRLVARHEHHLLPGLRLAVDRALHRPLRCPAL